jgi:hypothetical protein
LTAAGAALLPHTRALLERADDLRRRAEQLSGSEPVRLGYFNWLPADLTARLSGVAQVYVDPWVVPSHAQARRVADGSLDMAVCWVRAADLAEHGLRARLVGADRLHAVSTGEQTTPVPAREVNVLVDDDTVSWLSWNVFAEELAQATGARIHRIGDGGITGPAFFEHARRGGRPVLNSPQGQTTTLPPTSCGARWHTRRCTGRGRWSGAATRSGPPCSPPPTPSPGRRRLRHPRRRGLAARRRSARVAGNASGQPGLR